MISKMSAFTLGLPCK